MLVKENKFAIAGPLAKNKKQYHSIFILNIKSLEEAKAWLDTDVAVNAKLLDDEIFNRYGSAALLAYFPYHHKVKKSSF